MAKPTKHAAKICVGTGLFMGAGVVIGLVTNEPLWAVGGLVPVTAYQVYRTEGQTTTWASWALLLVLVLEAVLLVLGVDVDLAEVTGRGSEMVAGYEVPLGPITVVGPLMMGVLATILMVRTRGRYTRWLAGMILVGAGGLIYILDPAVFTNWLDTALTLI